MHLEADIHTHTIASGHYTTDTITDLVKAAVKKNLKLLGICEHGPAIPNSCQLNYFRNLAFAPSERMGIRLLYGAEVNILSFEGNLDMSNDVMSRLDYCIAGMHLPCCKPGTIEENTQAYCRAIENPYIKAIAHPDDVKYPVDYERLTKCAIAHHVFLEINNSSLSPSGYRGDLEAVKKNNLTVLNLCKKYHYPVLLSSDSHGQKYIGDFQYALPLIQEADFPKELILNGSADRLLKSL